MTPPLLPTMPKSKLRRTICALGDSLTDNLTLGNFGTEFWPALLEKYLNSKDQIFDGLAPIPGFGCDVKARNFGVSGNFSGPTPIGSAVANTISSSTNITLTSTAGTIAAQATILVNGQMSQIATWNSGTGVATLYYPLAGSSSGHAYPVLVMCLPGNDIFTRLNMAMGNKTPKNWDLIWQLGAPEWDPCDILALWTGVNDPAGGISPYISGLNLNSTIKTATSSSAAQWPLPAAGGYTLVPLQIGDGADAVLGQLVTIVDWTQNPPMVWTGLVCVVSGDTIEISANPYALDQNDSNWANHFFGGQNPLPGPAPPIGASVYQGTEANLIACVLYANQYAGISKFLIANTQYRNFAGGDTLNTPEPSYATLRTYQAAAVTLLAAQGIDVHLVDIYTLMRDRIVNLDTWSYRQTSYTAVAGDSAWHSVTSNQHLNPMGESMVAMAFLQTIKAANGWLDALHP